jgi:hypothetical protein
MLTNDTVSQVVTPIKIPLSKGKYYALVSPEHAEHVKQFTWSAVANKDGTRVYALRSEPGNNKKKIQLSHEIMALIEGRPLLPGESVRHRRRGSSLDYTKDNLILKGRK